MRTSIPQGFKEQGSTLNPANMAAGVLCKPTLASKRCLQGLGKQDCRAYPEAQPASLRKLLPCCQETAQTPQGGPAPQGSIFYKSYWPYSHPPLGVQLRVAQDLHHDRRAVPRGAAKHGPDDLHAHLYVQEHRPNIQNTAAQ